MPRKVWSANSPASYTFSSPGIKTLYAWAKDAAGNVSAAKSASITTIAKPGDCDYNSLVTIAEVQSAINMFLGLKAAEACVDIDNLNGASISEVQKTINSFLGL